MEKELRAGWIFVCKTEEERKRIWGKLKQNDYPTRNATDFSFDRYPNIATVRIEGGRVVFSLVSPNFLYSKELDEKSFFKEEASLGKTKTLERGMGFICETLEDKKRIWQKLTDAGYPMHFSYEDADINLLCIRFFHVAFASSDANQITDPLNESDFFDEWTPKAGDKVEVSDDGKTWFPEPQVFVVKWNNLYYSTSKVNNYLWPSNHIRQIKPETMTLQEAQDKLRELTGNANLKIID
jgi:hypothetical protein